MRVRLMLGVALSMISSVPAIAAPLGWITLGTKGGPVPNAERSQPANVLLVDGKPWLVDCGDGAMERLAGAGYKPTDIDNVFISHLHMDHIGGLQGLIGICWMMGGHTPLVIHGPPGTKVVVDALIASLAPSIAIARSEPMKGTDPSRMVQVDEIVGGADIHIGAIRVRAVRNSHFDSAPGRPIDNGSQSLSYRFDAPDYTIFYTGDTGPDADVTRLAHGANLLVSEVIDLDQARQVYDKKADMPADRKAAMLDHLATQHLTPQAAGAMAAEAGVGKLVFTHLSIYGPTAKEAPILIAGAHEKYTGDVEVARDLDRF